MTQNDPRTFCHVGQKWMNWLISQNCILHVEKFISKSISTCITLLRTRKKFLRSQKKTHYNVYLKINIDRQNTFERYRFSYEEWVRTFSTAKMRLSLFHSQKNFWLWRFFEVGTAKIFFWLWRFSKNVTN